MAMYPSQRRRQWLHPLRVLCALGLHRKDWEIAAGLFHCGRCCQPFFRRTRVE